MNDTVYCTIITKSHLAHARVLATTLSAHNRQSKLVVLLADEVNGYFDPGDEPFELILLKDLFDQEKIQQMSFYYGPSEFCFALRAWLHEYLLRKSATSKWVYLDADIMVCHSLEEISDQLERASILLSPHMLSIELPPGIDVTAIRKLESYLARNGGIYNGGFLGLSETDESEAFIDWFKEHLQFYAFDDRPMQSGDQFWLTFVPLYFRNVSLLRNPGANLAYWNLYERTIEADNSEGIRVNGEPLLFFHFAGFDIGSPERLTRYAIPQGLGVFPNPIRRLADTYRRLLLAHGYEDVKGFPYAFATFRSGQKITPLMRHLYFKQILHNKVNTGSPFEQYPYFRSHLRSQEMKNFFWKTGRNVVMQMRKWLNPNYRFEIP